MPVTPATDLPDYKRPPVAEVVMAAAFRAVEPLDTVQVGLMWRDVFSEDFPETEEKAHYVVQFERFGPPPFAEPTISFQAMDVPPWPRVWFLSQDGTQLMQLQRDWLARNWRRMPEHEEEEYPRYPALRARFEGDARRFVEYGQGWGDVTFTQTELTYINHIDLDDFDIGPGDLAEVLGLLAVPTNDLFLPSPESIQLNAQYLVREGEDPIARLYVTANPAFRRSDGRPILVLTLSAKGRPPGTDLDAVLRYLDTVREWIVKGFTNIARPAAQEVWGRRRDGE
jgi:uncharacterized protein (TIGR04255 family)